MSRPATGQVVELQRQRGRVFALRFRAYGKRQYMTLRLGTSRAEAEQELANVLADVRRGLWQPPKPEPREDNAWREEPTFHEFSSEWIAARKLEDNLSPRTIEDYEWALSYHLLPFFKDHLLAQITIREVDRYKTTKAAEAVLSPRIINKTLTRLSQILAVAVEYELIPANPAEGRRRRLKVKATHKSWVEPEQLMAFLSSAPDYGGRGKALLAVLAGAGLRISEALELQRRDVNLARGTLTVRRAKTEAGVRVVDLTPALSKELARYLGETSGEPDQLLFATKHGRLTTATTFGDG
jgi:integrase